MGPKTLSIGGATFDLFVSAGGLLRCDHDKCGLILPLGSKIRVEKVIETCGGGAANSSVGLRRLGCDAAFCGVVGSDQWGQILLETLKKEGVRTDTATVVEGETSSFSIILSSPEGERVILYAPGANVHLHDVTFDRDEAATADWIYLNRVQEEGMEIQNDIVALMEAGPKHGLTWNPGGTQIDDGMTAAGNRELLSFTTLLLLNKEEALTFTKAGTAEEAMQKLIDAGTKIVCITDGKNGAFASDGKQLYQCPALPDAKIVDTTGAGDAFGIGATWALLQGEDLPTALRAGTINATSVIGAIGAQAGLLTDTQMRQRLS